MSVSSENKRMELLLMKVMWTIYIHTENDSSGLLPHVILSLIGVNQRIEVTLLSFREIVIGFGS